MMTRDPKLYNAPVLRHTACRIGAHVFIYTREPERCDCGAYSYDEWMREINAQAQP